MALRGHMQSLAARNRSINQQVHVQAAAQALSTMEGDQQPLLLGLRRRRRVLGAGVPDSPMRCHPGAEAAAMNIFPSASANPPQSTAQDEADWIMAKELETIATRLGSVRLKRSVRELDEELDDDFAAMRVSRPRCQLVPPRFPSLCSEPAFKSAPQSPELLGRVHVFNGQSYGSAAEALEAFSLAAAIGGAEALMRGTKDAGGAGIADGAGAGRTRHMHGYPMQTWTGR